VVAPLMLGSAGASTPSSSSLGAPASGATSSTSAWTGGPLTAANPLIPSLCTSSTCDEHSLAIDVPADYWTSHDGSVVVDLTWTNATDDFDLWIYDADGNIIGSSLYGTESEQADLGELAPGSYTVQVVPIHAVDGTYAAKATLNLTGSDVPDGPMSYPESRKAVSDELTVDYPLNVVFVGRKPSAAEIADLRANIPTEYKPTVATKTTAYGEDTQAGAALLNWNQSHIVAGSQPYFEGIKYNYQLHVLQASDAYAKALFQVAEDNTAQAQAYHEGSTSTRSKNQVKYDATYGKFRVLAKGGDPSYVVSDPTKTDLVDAYSVEDWIFNSRTDSKWACAFTDAETGACSSPSVIDPDPRAYHDPYYDKSGLNLDTMPQGLNKGSSFFFLDTFTPDYAKDYFRPNAYHTYGTDKVINGGIVAKSVEDGGSWRITDPDTGDWDGVDFARTWGGRYRFHFVDLGAAPNDYEAASWAGKGLGMSNDYPHGDPPIWQYDADPLWQQGGDTCVTDIDPTLPYSNFTPCRLMPRLGRDVAYGLFFRSTAGYLYRPIPRGDVYWLATSTWTDFYSRPQWVQGQLANAPWYGTWWTDSSKLFKIGDVSGGTQQDDTLRWLSSATPYARWVGRKNEVIPLYDPTSNQPTGEVLDTSPKYEDLPAPQYHVKIDGDAVDVAPEPLYGGEHVHATYGDATVDLTEISDVIEKAKATGNEATPEILGHGVYDDAVNPAVVRDYIDTHEAGIADRVDGVNTIPSINMVFEKAYTWALPAIVGGVAFGTNDGEAWGVFNNVNDRFKSSKASYPGVQPGDAPGSKRSMTDVSLPTQDSGGGFSYTIEHEAAHNLGLSHPHDGSYGVSKCPAGQPNAGKWECYWSGLGWMYDISAAPTTYAMSYRPYEVEDQDNLQRGHVAEYLIAAQDALRNRLSEEAAAGRTTPSSAWSADFSRMKQWRTQAGQLFRNGDYLHAEYAARNASLAARGFPQTSANTSNPKLVGAGQIWYYNVHPQSSGVTPAKPNLKPTDLVASQPAPRQTVLTVTVANPGAAPATGVVVQLFDGTTSLGKTAAVDLAAGASKQVSLTWDTRGIKGDRQVKAVVDPAGVIAESDETDNSLTRTITVRGNKVTNGSFETSSSGTAPDGWTGSGTTSYDTSGAHASDGTDAFGLTGGLLTPSSVTSTAVPVVAGETLTFAATATHGATPTVSITWLDANGNVVSTQVVSVVSSILSSISGSVDSVTGTVKVPLSSIQAKVSLTAPADLLAGQTTWVDDVWVW